MIFFNQFFTFKIKLISEKLKSTKIYKLVINGKRNKAICHKTRSYNLLVRSLD